MLPPAPREIVNVPRYHQSRRVLPEVPLPRLQGPQKCQAYIVELPCLRQTDCLCHQAECQAVEEVDGWEADALISHLVECFGACVDDDAALDTALAALTAF